ncbi:hypothetical protein NMF47_21755 [Serratia nevei]|uniref:hypothetical protein n=1 Tax=Serratia TaxID=613 RepID=UPI0027E43FFE|nr:hypothetical protein [Serratia nevei]MDQ7771120.1 hypothetical protein [Serratia nevei]
MNYSDIAERIVKVLVSPVSVVGLASQGSADTDFYTRNQKFEHTHFFMFMPPSQYPHWFGGMLR